MKKVMFVTGSRADYGIVRKYLELLDKDAEINLGILATGALLSEKYGHQVELIYQDGFHIAAEIEIPLDNESNQQVVHTMAVTMDKFGIYFEENRPDLLIILGDRYEMLSVAVAAAMQKIPMLHLHGGEATFANYDEFIRHSITKMSMYHITATEEYRRRVIQLGENPERVFYLGALGAENCLQIEEENVPTEIKKLPNKKYFTVLFHPETLTDVNIEDQMGQLLDALKEYGEYGCVFLGSNADTHSDLIRNKVKEYVANTVNAQYYENLHTDAYHYLVKNAICLIGNSSSGIIEAPSLGAWTINIGDRQKGRVRGKSVVDVVCDKEAIKEAIAKVLSENGQAYANPYYKENTAVRYYDTTKNILQHLEEDMQEPKQFYDIAF